MTQDDLQHDLVGPAARGARDHGGHRRMVVFSAMLGGFVVILFALFLYQFLSSRSQINDLRGDVHSLVAAATDNANRAKVLEQQVRELGGVPKVTAAPGPPGQVGQTGQTGSPGPMGPPGPAGRDGRDGQSPPCLSEPAQCRGADGTNGRDGVDGTNGTDGADGRDGTNGADGQSPPCLSEPTQCRGADGKPPQGWVVLRADGTRETCTRDQDSPDSAPTYTCTDQPPSTDPPTTTTTSTAPAALTTTTTSTTSTTSAGLLPTLLFPVLSVPLLFTGGRP